MSKEKDSNVDRLPETCTWVPHVSEVFYHNVNEAINVEQSPTAMCMWNVGWKSQQSRLRSNLNPLKLVPLHHSTDRLPKRIRCREHIALEPCGVEGGLQPTGLSLCWATQTL